MKSKSNLKSITGDTKSYIVTNDDLQAALSAAYFVGEAWPYLGDCLRDRLCQARDSAVEASPQAMRKGRKRLAKAVFGLVKNKDVDSLKEKQRYESLHLEQVVKCINAAPRILRKAVVDAMNACHAEIKDAKIEIEKRDKIIKQMMETLTKYGHECSYNKDETWIVIGENMILELTDDGSDYEYKDEETPRTWRLILQVDMTDDFIMTSLEITFVQVDDCESVDSAITTIKEMHAIYENN